METKQTDSTQAELELSVIRKIMDDSRRVILDNGWHYIYWGSIVTIALIINYLMILNGVSGYYQGMLWFVSMVAASIVESIIERRREKKVKVKTFAGKLLNTLWSATGICMFMLGFVGTVSGAYNQVYIFPVISTVLGIAYYTSGAIQQIKWLSRIAFGWWSGAIVLFAFPGLHSMLVFGLMLVFFQTIPGIILFRKHRREMSSALKTDMA